MEMSESQRPCCAAASTKPRRGWLHTVAVLPAAILPLLPSATCPFCVAAYAGVLSFLGLGFLLSEQVLTPLISGFLVVGLVSVAWTTRSHRKPWPLVGTVIGSGAVVAGRLLWNVPVLLYAGAALLVASAVWNLWLKRRRRGPFIRIGSPASSRGHG